MIAFLSTHSFRSISSFWRRVSPAYIEQLGEDCAYGLDMRIFGYSVHEYMEGIGLGTYLEGYQETKGQNEQR